MSNRNSQIQPRRTSRASTWLSLDTVICPFVGHLLLVHLPPQLSYTTPRHTCISSLLHPLHPLQELTGNTLFPHGPSSIRTLHPDYFLSVSSETTDSSGPVLYHHVISLPNHTTQSKHSIHFDSLFN